ncbi:Hypp5400 [Branchiostoma lanceolatum]|uniref:Hypp5400 protein n=1 Tax=Branchiostoma lanceolatum TaxID=7740 RepID=A0A8K0EZF4_BRALA|nr:Hypp5400 [Branchiostoma lanceolatum]
MLRTLRKQGLDSHDLVLVYIGFVRPVLEYACQVWHPGLTVAESESIERKRHTRPHSLVQRLRSSVGPPGKNVQDRPLLAEVCVHARFQGVEKMSQIPAVPGAVQPPAGNQVGGAQVVQNPPGHDQAGGGRQQQNDGGIAAPQPAQGPEAALIADVQQDGGQPQGQAPPQAGGQPGVPRGGAGDQQAGVGLPPVHQQPTFPQSAFPPWASQQSTFPQPTFQQSAFPQPAFQQSAFPEPPFQQSQFPPFDGNNLNRGARGGRGRVKEVQEIRDSLQYSQKDIEEGKSATSQYEQRINEIEAELSQLKADSTTSVNKMDYLENQSRRNNIIVDGIPDSKEESWEESEQKVRVMIKEKLKLDPRKIEIERAHRNGRFQPGERPRPIVAKLLRFKDRLTILQNAKHLKGTGIYINEDFSDAVRQKRKNLLPEMRAARERGNIAFLRFDRLVVHPPRGPTRNADN